MKNTINVSNINSNKTPFNSNIFLQPIKVPYPVLIEKFNIVAKSDNILVGKDLFYGKGQLVIPLYPFDINRFYQDIE